MSTPCSAAMRRANGVDFVPSLSSGWCGLWGVGCGLSGVGGGFSALGDAGGGAAGPPLRGPAPPASRAPLGLDCRCKVAAVRFVNDPRLLPPVDLRGTGRRAGAIRPPNIAEWNSLGKDGGEARRDECPRAHVRRLFLQPHRFLQFWI